MDWKCEAFLLLMLLGQIPKVPCLTTNLAVETLTPDCPQAAMKGALKVEIKTNTTLDSEENLRIEWEIELTEAGEVRLCGIAGMFQLLRCTNFYLPNSFPSFLMFHSKDPHRTATEWTLL